ncbi:hypothetical protein Goari_005605, partial [Gossypium aridum]|nr:hypothetical protein [Gossypium aridum]
MEKPVISKIRGHLQEARFLHVPRMTRGCKLDLTLINTLWLVITGLAIIPGKVDLCKALLGKVSDKFEGGRISINWFEDNFDELLSIHHEVNQGILMPEKSRNLVHVRWLLQLVDFNECGKPSWKSIVLSTLYQEMRRATVPNMILIGGCLPLLWNHGPSYMGLPDELEDFRLLLDQRSEAEFEWISYTDTDIISCILSGVLANREIWDAKMSLRQRILPPPRYLKELHNVDIWGKNDDDWAGHNGRCRVPTMAQTHRQVVSAIIEGEDKENLAHEVHISLHRRPSHTSPPTNPNVGSNIEACTTIDDDADADAHATLDIDVDAWGNADIPEIWGTL